MTTSSISSTETPTVSNPQKLTAAEYLIQRYGDYQPDELMEIIETKPHWLYTMGIGENSAEDSAQGIIDLISYICWETDFDETDEQVSSDAWSPESEVELLQSLVMVLMSEMNFMLQWLVEDKLPMTVGPMTEERRTFPKKTDLNKILFAHYFGLNHFMTKIPWTSEIEINKFIELMCLLPKSMQESMQRYLTSASQVQYGHPIE